MDNLTPSSITESDRRPRTMEQRERARRWMIAAFQPVYRQGRPGHTWPEIVKLANRHGDGPKCSETTLKRARRGVLDNVREGEVSYWRLRREHEVRDED